MAVNLKALILSFKSNVEDKLNYLYAQLGEVSPYKGLSLQAGNSLTEDGEGKLYFKERTPDEIVSAYESLLDVNRFSNAYKQTVDGLSQGLIIQDSRINELEANWPLTSDDNSIKIQDNDFAVNTDGWDLAQDYINQLNF